MTHPTPETAPAPAGEPSALVPVRERQDGWTPARQRAFIEVLADTGSVTAAAQSVGMSTQSAYRLRRRDDARAFDAAWEAALERAMQLLVPAALDRALHGTVRQRWYHGEMIAEERVFSDKLLLHLLAQGERMLAHAAARGAIRENWSGAMGALEHGAADAPGPMPRFTVERIGDDYWATNCPPPPDYDGPACGAPGDPDYLRYLDENELAAWLHRSVTPTPAQESQRRRFFGLDGMGSPPAGELRRPGALRPVRGRKRAGGSKRGKIS